MSNKILKKRDIQADKLKLFDEVVEKYNYIIVGFGDGKGYKQIAEEHGIKVPTMQKRVNKLFALMEEIEPNIKKLYLKFDTFLDLSKEVEPEWSKTVAKMVAKNVKNSFVSPIKKDCVADKALKHEVLRIKADENHSKPYNSIQAPFLKKISKELPITIEVLASQLKLNPKRLEEFLETLFSERICIIDKWILSTRKSLFKSIALYGENLDKIGFSGTLEDLYKKFNKKCSKMFFNFDIKNYSDFVKYVKSRIDIFPFVRIREDTREHELQKYMKDNNIKEYIHYLRKK